jgi:mannose-6-phosphate isomerase-like protein (cupin superfamily)
VPAADDAGRRVTKPAVSPRLGFIELGQVLPGIEYGELQLERDGASVAPFKASRLRIDPGQPIPQDCHKVRECWFIAGGRGSLTYAGTTIDVEQGDALFYESEHPHTITNTGSETLIIFSIWWPQPAPAAP